MPTLTKAQEARRQRVIRAAFELAAAGGYDAVQMRDVAATADVALGTIYRYFSSKDHLLAEVQVEWVRDLSRRVHARPPRSGTIADRAVDVLRRATRAMEQEPKLAEALVTALASNDPHAARCQAEIGAAMADAMALAFPDDFDAQRRDDTVRILGHVWFTSLVGWVNNWFGITKAADELELAAHLLLDQYE
jgi:AcrR family transcriptional regulator